MAFDEFRAVVIGNEPAGLWLLSALDREFRANGEQAKLGWVSLSSDAHPVPMPTALCPSFGIAPSAAWSAELITPRASIPWNTKALAERFSELPAMDSTRDPLTALQQPLATEMAAIRSAIAKKPELIAYAQGLWKILGRTQEVLPESAVHYSRYLTGLQWWNPERELSQSVQRITLSPTDNALEAFKSRSSDGMSVQFKNFGEITSRKWILNMDLRTLRLLCASSPGFLDLLNLDLDAASLQALYPMSLLVEPEAIPSPVSPLTVWFDTDLIPDVNTEVWPISLQTAKEQREVTVWSSGSGMVALESTLDVFRQAMKRACRLFPFLSQKLVHVPIPLGMDSCFDEASRRAVSDRLVETSWEKYRQTSLYTETRTPAISLLMPYIGCHLPYPVGALVAARNIVGALVPKKKRIATENVVARPEGP